MPSHRPHQRRTTRAIARTAAVALAVCAAVSCGDDDERSSSTSAAPLPSDTSVPAATAGGSTPGTGDTTDTTGAGDGKVPMCETADMHDDVVESFGELDLSGIEVRVGSKNFAEQRVLGFMLVFALRGAGAEVVNKVNLGGTTQNRQALVGGGIDAYWEYNGVAWTNHLKQAEVPERPQLLTNLVCELDLAENDVRWLGRSDFDNSIRFATPPGVDDNGAPFTIESMGAFLRQNPTAKLCVDTEFLDRPDGMVLLEDAMGYEVPLEQVVVLDTRAVYEQTARGACDFAEVYNTDGRIESLDLGLVDDTDVMPINNVSLTMTDELYRRAPQAFEQLADTLLAGLDDAAMRRLNQDVVEHGARRAARSYLESRGLIER